MKNKIVLVLLIVLGLLQGVVGASEDFENIITNEPDSLKRKTQTAVWVNIMGLYWEDRIAPFLGGSGKFWIREKIEVEGSCHSNIVLTLVDFQVIMRPFYIFRKLYIGVGGGVMTGIIILAGVPFVPYPIISAGMDSFDFLNLPLHIEGSYYPLCQFMGIKIGVRL